MGKKWFRNGFVYLILLLAVVVLFFTAFPQPDGGETQLIALGEVAAGVKDGSVRRILASDNRLQVEYQDRRKAASRMDANGTLTRQLRDYGATQEQLEKASIVFVDPPQLGNWLQILFYYFLPFIFFGALLLLLLRQVRATHNLALALGRSRAQTFAANESPRSVADLVFLIEEAPEGGCTARALGASIFAEADKMEDLHEQVRDAVGCHFDEADRPRFVRLHLLRDEVIAV